MMPTILLLAAGTLKWAMAWVYVGLIIVFTLLSRVIALRRNPDLLVERAHSLEAEDVKSWDRFLVSWTALLGPLCILIIAGLDYRFGWSPQVSLSLQLFALGLIILGYLFSTWAMVENKFFSAYVRIQSDRRQIVITSGPYRFVRHPGYAGGIIAILATPLLLGSIWAFIPTLMVVVGMIMRTALEDQVLLDELDGYQDYAKKVNYRLIPGIW